MKRIILFLLIVIPLSSENITIKPFDEIRSSSSDIAPCITPDGRYIVFQSNRGIDDDNDFAIFETFLGKGKKWTSPKKIVFDDYSTFEGLPYFSGTDGWVYYTSLSSKNLKKPGKRAKADIWVSRRIRGGWLTPKPLGAPVNSTYSETGPWLSFNGRTIYFSSNRPGGMGGFDIWYSNRMGNRWSTPVNMGPNINSTADEVYPRVHSDDKVFYYSSNRAGGKGLFDIYVSRRRGSNWSRATNAGSVINTSSNEYLNSVPATAKFLLLSRGDDGEEKIFWVSPVPSLLTPTPTTLVRFIVIDTDTKIPLKFNLEIQDELAKKTIFDRDYAPYDKKPYKAGKQVVLDESTAAAYFNRLGLVVPLNMPKRYGIHVTSKGYFFNEDELYLRRNSTAETEKVVHMTKLRVGAIAALRSIHFKPRTAKPSKASYASLKRIVRFMKRNRTIVLEVSGHTDNRGGKKYNKKLSKKRAKAIRKWLSKKGIRKSRLKAKGYGQTKPLMTNDSDANRAKNRRVEFKILRL